MKKTQKPLRHLSDEIYDQDMDCDQKVELKNSYDMFFATLTHKTRIELHQFLIEPK